MKKFAILLAALFLVSCDDSLFWPKGANAKISAYVHWMDQGLPGKQIVLVETADTLFTDSSGVAVFSVKAGMIENNFNSWLENNVLYVADDIYSTRDRADMMEALKSMITETDHGITLKGIDSIQKRICGNFVFTDNHKDAMKKTDDSRRICTLYCAQQSKHDRMRDGLTKQFFVGPNGFVKWLNGGGYAAVADMLHTMVIDERYNPAGECQEAPDTSVTHEAIVDGRTAVEHEVAESDFYCFENCVCMHEL